MDDDLINAEQQDRREVCLKYAVMLGAPTGSSWMDVIAAAQAFEYYLEVGL